MLHRNALNGVRVRLNNLSDKYQPVAPVDKLSLMNVFDYFKSHPLEAAKYAGLSLSSVTTLSVDLLNEIPDRDQKRIKDWTWRELVKEKRESYFNQVVQTVQDSAGQLKTFPEISASSRNLV